MGKKVTPSTAAKEKKKHLSTIRTTRSKLMKNFKNILNYRNTDYFRKRFKED